MQKFSLIVPRTARFFALNSEQEIITDIWIVVHGYGQLAQYFLRHFETVAAQNPHLLILAPEGLSRYYVEGFSGRVGASWMTKEDRESEIADQSNYFDALSAHFLAKHPAAKLHLLGFSQGIATAWRWICFGQYNIQSLCLWAGEVPKEFPPVLLDRLGKIPIFYVYGLQDELIASHLFEQQFQFLQNHFHSIKAYTFEGKHTLDKELLSMLGKEIFALSV